MAPNPLKEFAIAAVHHAGRAALAVFGFLLVLAEEVQRNMAIRRPPGPPRRWRGRAVNQELDRYYRIWRGGKGKGKGRGGDRA